MSYPLDLRAARRAARLTVPDACALVGCHRTTWTRQESGASAVNRGWYQLLIILAGRLPWSGWGDWEMVGGLLYPPQWASGLSPDQVASVFFLRQAFERRLGPSDAETSRLPAPCDIQTGRSPAASTPRAPTFDLPAAGHAAGLQPARR